MVKCPSCGNMNRDDYIFCEECGTKLEQKYFCETCGKELKQGKRFCSGCGAKVNYTNIIPPAPSKSLIGDKNIISGGMGGVHITDAKTTYNVYNTDDTKKIICCSVCGVHTSIDRIYTCPSCGEYACRTCFDSKKKLCTKCSEKEEQELLISQASIYLSVADEMTFGKVSTPFRAYRDIKKYCNSNNDNLKKAFEIYSKLAGIGNKEAMDMLGCFLVMGKGCEKNMPQGIEWLEKAAECEFGWAFLSLGDIHEESFRANKSQKEYQAAKAAFSAPCATSISSSYSRLAHLCEVYGDYVIAKETYEKMYRFGDANAAHKIATLYETGKLGEESSSLSTDWHEKGASKDIEEADSLLFHGNGSYRRIDEIEANASSSSSLDKGKAVSLYWKQSQLDSAIAKNMIACCLFLGYGTIEKVSILELLESSLSQGFLPAAYNIGQYYLKDYCINESADSYTKAKKYFDLSKCDASKQLSILEKTRTDYENKKTQEELAKIAERERQIQRAIEKRQAEEEKRIALEKHEEELIRFKRKGRHFFDIAFIWYVAEIVLLLFLAVIFWGKDSKTQIAISIGYSLTIILHSVYATSGILKYCPRIFCANEDAKIIKQYLYLLIIIWIIYCIHEIIVKVDWKFISNNNIFMRVVKSIEFVFLQFLKSTFMFLWNALRCISAYGFWGDSTYLVANIILYEGILIFLAYLFIVPSICIAIDNRQYK